MKNGFYRAFDWETASGYPRPQDYRTPFQIDRDRVLHTSAFRRLQSKTQVFLSGEYDFYRTRLTHSLEVAQIGRAICHYLQESSDLLSEDAHIDPDLVEAACLSHDLGHPPFGHGGERTLHCCMKPFGGFEGNAQTLRMLTETIYSEPAEGRCTGMNPTRGFLDGILKYKAFHREVPHAKNHFIYDDQDPWLAFVFGDSWDSVRTEFPGTARNDLRSIECQIMDWADDTAYSLNDLVDGIAAGFLTIERIEHWAGDQDLRSSESEALENLLRAIRERRIEKILGRKIGFFISSCQIAQIENSPLKSLTNRYAYQLTVDPEAVQEAALYKRLALDVVFRSQPLQQLDHKGDHILRSLMDVLAKHYLDPSSTPDAPLRLLPPLVEKLLETRENLAERARILCDHVSNMTDGSASRTYKRLFDPEFGSIVDLV